jgi:serine/threonine protein kinase
LPFEGAPTGLIYKHVYEPPPRPKQLRPELPMSLDTLVLRLLHKDPERRPSNAYEVADELTRILQLLPETVPRSSAGPSARPSGEAPTSAVWNEEDRWQNNLLALQTRIRERYSNTDPPDTVKAAMKRVAELVDEAHTLRKHLGEISVTTLERHDAARNTQLRIGTAIDTLALDEARTAQEYETLSSQHKRETEELQHAARKLLAARTAFAEAAAPAERARSSQLLETWARAQETVFRLQDRLTEKEVACADLRFQISHLKGRLAGLDAEQSVDLEPSEVRSSQLQAELSAKLFAIRAEAERITEQLGPRL